MAKDLETGGHLWFKCPKGCERPGCPFCEGVLALCMTCGAAEGELLTYCPGYQLNPDAQMACYSGNVFDFHRLKLLKSFAPTLFRETVSRMNENLKRGRLSSEKLC